MDLNRDEFFIKKCFELAKKGKGKVLPNPMVGCVVVKNGEIISSGYHKKYGEFHAERNALLKEADFEGATLYVNLEPCSHFGKTPPCTDIIIEKKIKRVVFSNFDPNKKVDGISKLKEAGIEITGGILEKEGEKLNKVFFKNIKTDLPYVALKTATTLDSKIATKNYDSKWITNETSRKKVMELRGEYQAILTGSNTVRLDNPRLTARIEGVKNPIRIIMDKKGTLDLSLNVFNNDGTRIIVIDNSDKNYPDYIEKIPFLNMKNLMETLYKMGVCSILVESGGGLNSAIIKERLVDEVYHFIAPKILGGGIDFVSGFEPLKLKDALEVEDLRIEKFDTDILLNYFFKIE